MKTKLLLFFAFFLTSFYLSAQINSVALVGEAVGGWPNSPGNPGPTDINQLTQVSNDYWSIQNIVVSVGDCKFRANNSWGGQVLNGQVLFQMEQEVQPETLLGLLPVYIML